MPSYVVVMGPQGGGKTTAYERVLADLRREVPHTEDAASAHFHHHKLGSRGRVYMRGSRARRNLPPASRAGGIVTHLRDLARREPRALLLVEGGFWRQENTLAAARAAGFAVDIVWLQITPAQCVTGQKGRGRRQEQDPAEAMRPNELARARRLGNVTIVDGTASVHRGRQQLYDHLMKVARAHL